MVGRFPVTEANEIGYSFVWVRITEQQLASFLPLLSPPPPFKAGERK